MNLFVSHWFAFFDLSFVGTFRDDVAEAATARDHGQHMLNVRHHDIQQVWPRRVLLDAENA